MKSEENDKFKPGTLILGYVDGKRVCLCKLAKDEEFEIYREYFWLSLDDGTLWNFLSITDFYEIDNPGKAAEAAKDALRDMDCSCDVGLATDASCAPDAHAESCNYRVARAALAKL